MSLKKDKEPMQVFSLRLTPELLESIKTISKDSDLNVSDLIRYSIKYCINNHII